MDKLRDNSRLIVAGLITAGIIALLISNSGSNNTTDQATTSTDATQSQTQDTEDTEENQEAVVDESVPNNENSNQTNTDDVVIGRTPSSGPVTVDTVDDGFQATVRKNDNQTVIVRQIISDYLAASTTQLSAEKRVYIETVLVDALPRREVVQVGDIISVSKNKLDEAIEASNKLTETELKRWARYL